MPGTTRFFRVDHTLVQTLGRLVDRGCPASLSDHREDIVQEILVRLHRSSLERPLNIGLAYLRRAAQHGIYDAWRRQTRTQIDDEVEVIGDEPTPEHQAAGRFALAVADRLLRTLPHARREAVSLYLEGWRIAEIADTLGCSRKRADNLVYRGLGSLRSRLAERGYGPECAAVQ